MSDDHAFVIGKQEIQPGENALVKMRVGALPSGTSIFVNAYVFRSKNPGPVILVQGGVHGDEINGIEIVRNTIESGLYKKIKKGSVIAIPLLNVYGFINFSRDVSDGKDVNRSFPGNSRGSMASRVAHALTTDVLPHIDIGIDFHTGGKGRYNYPQIRLTKDRKDALNLAKDFGVPFILEKPVINKSLRKLADKFSIPMIVFEGGESLRLDSDAIDFGIKGIKNILFSKGMIGSLKPSTPAKQFLIRKSSWLRASASGIFTWTRKSGDFIEIGDELGTIKDPFGSRVRIVKSTKTGYIVGHNNTPVVSHGDPLFHIGYQYEMVS